MPYFQYGDKETQALKAKDPILGKAIEAIGHINRRVNHDVFEEMIDSIIAQQISNKSAVTVSGRLREKVGEITPFSVHHLPIEDIQSCGMSMRKAGYIKDAARSAILGTPRLKSAMDFAMDKEMGNKVFNLDTLHEETDEAIIKILSNLNGIGKWTAQMLMIFAMERPDVISYDDLAIRRGICKLYGLEALSKKEFEAYQARYSPYGSVASFYIWHSS